MKYHTSILQNIYLLLFLTIISNHQSPFVSALNFSLIPHQYLHAIDYNGTIKHHDFMYLLLFLTTISNHQFLFVFALNFASQTLIPHQ